METRRFRTRISELERQRDDAVEASYRIAAERDEYRAKLGMALDLAHEIIRLCDRDATVVDRDGEAV